MFTRRQIVALGIGGAAAAAATTPSSAQRFVAERKLSPGQFTWNPERAPAGPVVLIVSVPEQLVHVYRNGIEIGVSTCSTGRPGHRTPTGVFTILEKQRQHVSSIYKGAQMPNMERLTWGGIALHAGNLPGYPASHGCVRLPHKFSALLFEVTHLGVVVIIADERTQPANVAHPGPMLSRAADVEARALATHVAQKTAHGAWDAVVSYPVTSVVISRHDGRAYIARNGALEGTYPVGFRNAARPIGTHTYTLIGPSADGTTLNWLAFGIGRSRSDAHIVGWRGDDAMRRVIFHNEQRAMDVARSLHPGATLLITDAAAPHSTRNAPGDFSVMVSDHPA